MKFIIKLYLAILACIFSFSGFAYECNSDCQLLLINEYFKSLDNIQRAGSTDKDIENMLAQVHSEIKYEHFEYQANFNKETWHKAFMRRLELGSYNSTNRETRVLNKIFGKSHVAIEYSYGTISSNGDWKEENHRFVLFGFKDGKIVLIREYW